MGKTVENPLMHIYERVAAMAAQIDKTSDMSPVAVGTKITFEKLGGVQPEVLDWVTRAALSNGITRFEVAFKESGSIEITATTDSDNLCFICGGTATERHDDGVCFLCRDPNLEPGEQTYMHCIKE